MVCGRSSGVERNLAKVEVVSSNLIARSIFLHIKNVRRPRASWGFAYAGLSRGDR